MPANRHTRHPDQKFRLLFDEHPQPMWIMDTDTQEFLAANSAACSLYEYTHDEFMRLHLASLQQPAEAERLIEELSSPTRPAASAWRHQTKSGRLIDVEVALHDV